MSYYDVVTRIFARKVLTGDQQMYLCGWAAATGNILETLPSVLPFMMEFWFRMTVDGTLRKEYAQGFADALQSAYGY